MKALKNLVDDYKMMKHIVTKQKILIGLIVLCLFIVSGCNGEQSQLIEKTPVLNNTTIEPNIINYLSDNIIDDIEDELDVLENNQNMVCDFSNELEEEEYYEGLETFKHDIKTLQERYELTPKQLKTIVGFIDRINELQDFECVESTNLHQDNQDNIMENEPKYSKGYNPPIILQINDSLGNVFTFKNGINQNQDRPIVFVGDKITFTIKAIDHDGDEIYYYYKVRQDTPFKWVKNNVYSWEVSKEDLKQWATCIKFFVRDNDDIFYHSGIDADQEMHLYYNVRI